MHHIKQVQYVKLQEDHIFLTSLCLYPFKFGYTHVGLQ